MEGLYTVKTKVFEGPLDLLLELVSQRKLFVNDVSLAEVTDDFIMYLEQQEQFPINESAEFILIASTLILIKSRSLLPNIELTTEEEESINDLEDRLIVYAKTKKLALNIKSIFGKMVIFEKKPKKIESIIFAPDTKTDISNIGSALEQVISSFPKKEKLQKVLVRKIISLEEMIVRLSEKVSKMTKISFKDFHGQKGEITHEKKVSIIVGFLAMLELVKRGAIRATQGSKGEIEIEHEGVNIPNYT